jgi:hypothetical protein
MAIYFEHRHVPVSNLFLLEVLHPACNLHGKIVQLIVVDNVLERGHHRGEIGIRWHSEVRIRRCVLRKTEQLGANFRQFSVTYSH